MHERSWKYIKIFVLNIDEPFINQKIEVPSGYAGY